MNKRTQKKAPPKKKSAITNSTNRDDSSEIAFQKIKQMMYRNELSPGQKVLYKDLAKKLDKPYFKPPKLLEKQVKAGKLGLKSAGGFYDYGPGAVDAMRRDRDRKFYARLELVRKEWEQES